MFESTKLYVLGLLLFVTSLSYGQVEKTQAGLFYYFSKYIEWPVQKQSGDFVIAVVGNDALLPHLKEMALSKRMGSRKIVVKQLSSVAQAGDAHIMYVAGNQLSQFGMAMAVAASKNVLLVTNESGYGQKGAGINLTLNDGRPAYQINEGVLQSSGLKTSARLSSLGTSVH